MGLWVSLQVKRSCDLCLYPETKYWSETPQAAPGSPFMRTLTSTCATSSNLVTLPQCKWWILHQNQNILKYINVKSRDDHAISGMIDECTEDTTPTRWFMMYLPFIRISLLGFQLGSQTNLSEEKTNDEDWRCWILLNINVYVMMNKI